MLLSQEMNLTAPYNFRTSVLIVHVAQAMDAVCSTVIGKMPTTFNNRPTDTSRLSGLFLNTKNKSPYDGNVTAWDFCYYIGPGVTPMTNITIQAGVWRESGGMYTLVDDSLIDLPIPDPETGFQFVCRHWVLNNSDDELPFAVEKGDVVGMYVYDTSDNSMVHILGTHLGETDAGIMKSTDTITDINSETVSNSTLSPVNYSLYLVAQLDDRNDSITCSTTTPTTTGPPTMRTASITSNMDTSTSTPNMDNNTSIEVWEIVLICVLGIVILVLVIIIIPVVYKLYYLNRIKGSGPVLITNLKHGNKGPAKPNAQLNCNSENASYELSQPTTRVKQPLYPPPLINAVELLTAPDQDEVASSLNGIQSPPPVVFAIAFDNDQQARDDQDEATLNQPNLRDKNPHTKAQKVALLPKLDLRRSRSAAEAMNLSNTNTAQTIDDLFTSSSEYPYVVHSFEAMEKDRGVVGSLPNMLQFALNHPTSNVKYSFTQDDENTNTDIVPYANTRVDSSSDPDFNDTEPAYSYADRRELMQNCSNGKDINFFYEEYPSDWTHAVQEPTKPTTDCQSPVYQNVDDYQEIDNSISNKPQSVSAVQSSNHASPQKQSSGAKENNTLLRKSKPKPPIQPRKNLPQTITPSNPSTQPSMSAAEHQSSTNEIDDGANSVNAQTPNKYMKLLPSTMDDFQVYTYLRSGISD